MVFPADSTPPNGQPPPPAPSPVLRAHDVIVPCYLRLHVMAEDDLHAEVAAVEMIRRIGPIPVPGGAAHVLSIISPIVNHPNLPPPA